MEILLGTIDRLLAGEMEDMLFSEWPELCVSMRMNYTTDEENLYSKHLADGFPNSNASTCHDAKWWLLLI